MGHDSELHKGSSHESSIPRAVVCGGGKEISYKETGDHLGQQKLG